MVRRDSQSVERKTFRKSERSFPKPLLLMQLGAFGDRFDHRAILIETCFPTPQALSVLSFEAIARAHTGSSSSKRRYDGPIFMIEATSRMLRLAGVFLAFFSRSQIICNGKGCKPGSWCRVVWWSDALRSTAPDDVANRRTLRY